MVKSYRLAALCLAVLAAGPLWAQAPRVRISDGEISGVREGKMRDITRDRGLGALYSYCRDRLTLTRQPMYVYLFDHTEPGPQAQRYRAFHSAEISYIFNTLDAAPERGLTAQDRALEGLLSGYWVSFVRGGNPNGDARPQWPRMQASDFAIMELGDRTGPRPILPPATLGLMRELIRAGGSPSFF